MEILQLERLKALESRIEKLEGSMGATNTKVGKPKVVQICALKHNSGSGHSDMHLFALMSDGNIRKLDDTSRWDKPWECIPLPGEYDS